MDETEFGRAVEDALGHLYDYPYLQTHHLAGVLLGEHGVELRGRALQRRLIETIQALRPDSDVPFSASAWRSYRYLYLRYVQAQEPVQVARELGVSLRQSQRSHQQALRAISSALWDACQPRRRSAVADASPQTLTGRNGASSQPDGGTVPSSAPDPSPLGAELERIATGHGQGAARLDETFAGVLATVGPLATSRGIELAVSVPVDPPAIAVERGLLRQALVSLLVLCLEHATSTVRLAASVAPHHVDVRLAIQGPRGPAPRVAGQPDLPPRAGEGDGLAELGQQEGFIVSERLLAASGIALAAVPTAGGGVEIYFRAPVATVATVLVVEDNPDAAILFERYLVNEPYDVLAAGTGEEAMELARQKHPSVITLDLMMPTQDGWEVLQTLKNDPKTHEVPVIVCSVLKQRDLALLLGAAEFLPKPVSRPAFLQALRRCLELSPAASRARPGDSGSALRPGVPATE